ncbi:MAG: hypothetical protein KDK37_14465 [Leptospiraceae bacterium]|nr:hypothetical protein [Leptospiraceae bacterium]
MNLTKLKLTGVVLGSLLLLHCPSGGGGDNPLPFLLLGSEALPSGTGSSTGATEPLFETSMKSVTPSASNVLTDYYGAGINGYVADSTTIRAGGEHPLGMLFAAQDHNMSYPIDFYFRESSTNYFSRNSIVGYEFNGAMTHYGSNSHFYTSPGHYVSIAYDYNISIQTVVPKANTPTQIWSIRSLLSPTAAERSFSADLYTSNRRERGMNRSWALRKHLNVNLIFVEGANANANLDDFAPAIAKMQSLYGQPTVAIELVVTATTVPGTSDLLTIDELSDESGTAPGSLRYLITQTADAQRADALNIIITREEIDVGGVLGVSGGIPGMVGFTGTLQNAVVIFVEGHQTISGLPLSFSELEFIGTTMAHEGGHYLGLSHLVESGGQDFGNMYSEDPLIETPVCSDLSDDNNDGFVSLSECDGTGISDSGARNVMFWAGDPAFSQEYLTGEQGWMLRRNPLVY